MSFFWSNIMSFSISFSLSSWPISWRKSCFIFCFSSSGVSAQRFVLNIALIFSFTHTIIDSPVLSLFFHTVSVGVSEVAARASLLFSSPANAPPVPKARLHASSAVERVFFMIMFIWIRCNISVGDYI